MRALSALRNVDHPIVVDALLGGKDSTQALNGHIRGVAEIEGALDTSGEERPLASAEVLVKISSLREALVVPGPPHRRRQVCNYPTF